MARVYCGDKSILKYIVVVIKASEYCKMFVFNLHRDRRKSQEYISWQGRGYRKPFGKCSKDILLIFTSKKTNKADIYEKIVFLNFKLKKTAGGACCLTKYEIIVGKLHFYKIKKVYILPQSKNHNLKAIC